MDHKSKIHTADRQALGLETMGGAKLMSHHILRVEVTDGQHASHQKTCAPPSTLFSMNFPVEDIIQCKQWRHKKISLSHMVLEKHNILKESDLIPWVILNWLNPENFSYQVKAFEPLAFLSSSTYSFRLNIVVMPSHSLYPAVLALSWADRLLSAQTVMFISTLSEPLACDTTHVVLWISEQFSYVSQSKRSSAKGVWSKDFLKNSVDFTETLSPTQIMNQLHISPFHIAASLIRQNLCSRYLQRRISAKNILNVPILYHSALEIVKKKSACTNLRWRVKIKTYQ